MENSRRDDESRPVCVGLRNCPTFSRRIFSLTNHIAEIWFSLRANKFAKKRA
jgi:hypothetical protein